MKRVDAEVLDPVCGMRLGPMEGLALTRPDGSVVRFCSALCMRAFVATPEQYGTQPAELAELDPRERRIAYFSMEIAVDSALPTYCGGLGVLAGDMLRSCADLRVPAVGVTLLYRDGYFKQTLDDMGNQREEPESWDPAKSLRPLAESAQVTIEGRPVTVRAWVYELRGVGGYRLPVLFLDTALPENAASDRELTARLYGGDERYRLAQEIVLGIGGVRILRALGYTGIERFHMNEGHGALIGLELLRQSALGNGHWKASTVRGHCVFTTHTPVPAGHDQFRYELVRSVLGSDIPVEVLQMLGGNERLNMTLLAMNLSQYVNGVARRHGELSREMFPRHVIDAVPNGVHSVSWTSPSFARLFDAHVTGWRTDPHLLRNALSIPNDEIRDAHREAKLALLDAVKRRTGAALDPECFTIGFARRATRYKRLDLLLRNAERLGEIVRKQGPVQIVLAGKAHPNDEPGKELIRLAFRRAHELPPEVRLVYAPGYDLALARLLTAGVDVWLNTPIPPLEASGTSGMKAAHNGVPSLSIRDGWWIEGHVEGVTGWCIGNEGAPELLGEARDTADATSLYDKLERVVMPLFYSDPEGWSNVMRHTIAINASFFNTHRMVQQYAASAYV